MRSSNDLNRLSKSFKANNKMNRGVTGSSYWNTSLLKFNLAERSLQTPGIILPTFPVIPLFVSAYSLYLSN